MTVKNQIKKNIFKGLVGLASIGVLGGCSKEHPDTIIVSATHGHSTLDSLTEGRIVFSHITEKTNYHDIGYDGTLDKVIYHKRTEGKWERVEIDSTSPEFKSFIPKYEKVRKLATKDWPK